MTPYTTVCFAFYTRTSTRVVSIYRSDDVSKPAYTLSLDVKPAIVIPHYDADSSSLFLTGRVSHL